jgi:hypothetical protein
MILMMLVTVGKFFSFLISFTISTKFCPSIPRLILSLLLLHIKDIVARLVSFPGKYYMISGPSSKISLIIQSINVQTQQQTPVIYSTSASSTPSRPHTAIS